MDDDNRRSPRRCSPPPSTSASPPASRSWRASPLQSTPRRDGRREYFVEFVLGDTSGLAPDQLADKWQQEAVAAGNAASAGLLRRLWLRPDGLPALGVWQATDRETLDRALEGLPMAPRLMMPVTHLDPHPMNCANTTRGSGRLNRRPNEPVSLVSSSRHSAISSAVTSRIIPGQRQHADPITRSPTVVVAAACLGIEAGAEARARLCLGCLPPADHRPELPGRRDD
ncbi:muconolactone Delta-isomerase family protein [Streptomyces sp. GESEQ-35]|uniref:muconolactone Delta-isomerase family protein n=1 Tax=Streptomyces sp. GESEQ-35 TaxID=2812657 RepID=UPI001B32786E